MEGSQGGRGGGTAASPRCRRAPGEFALEKPGGWIGEVILYLFACCEMQWFVPRRDVKRERAGDDSLKDWKCSWSSSRRAEWVGAWGWEMAAPKLGDIMMSRRFRGRPCQLTTHLRHPATSM